MMEMTIEKVDPAQHALAKNFTGDVSCVIEEQLPLLRCVVSPRKQKSTLTFSELQQSVSVMLFHCAYKAQCLDYTQGYEAINCCFKHFMYLCSHIDSTSPQSCLSIINGIDDILSQTVSIFDPVNTSFDPALKDSNSSTVHAAVKKLDGILIGIANKS